MDSYTGYIVETLVMLLALCALAAVILLGARKLGIGRATGPISLVGQLPIDARRQIVLVRIGSQVLVVGVGEGGFTKLGEIAEADLPLPATSPGSASFPDVLARVLARPPREEPVATISGAPELAQEEPASAVGRKGGAS